MFSNAFDLDIDTSILFITFSPNNSKLYLETGKQYARLYQFDLSVGIDSIINLSKTLIHANNPYYGIGLDGQIGLDGKIYLTIEHINPFPRDALSVIENPNTQGIVRVFDQSLNGRWARQGLPNFVSNFLTNEQPAPCKYTFVYDNSDEIDNTIIYPNPADEWIQLPQNGSISSLGEVFRTDAPNTSGNHTYWRMYHGGVQKFNINNPYNSNDIFMGTVEDGTLNFFTNHTNYSSPRMTITGGTDATGGNVGIGTTKPTEKLEVNGNIKITGKILVADDANTYDLLTMILQLQNEVGELKRQLTTSKN
ncbi:MAG: hypothetical protein KatS3mg031_3103 [Chitinophagales bacterium]|nr:MAG: hypothetical protein KatS3mg031_3103 [Chitinophagales bacterium]